ncbi:MAG: DUF4281 domain-containing protein [Saprospiraceae bacterium]|nr:DUF4281 domain-containing protein [Saprospiraceae bacterium]
MDIQFLFKVFNFGVLIPWAIMIFFPRWSGTNVMLKSLFPVLIIAVSYLFLVLWDAFVSVGGTIDFTSFESIKEAFARDQVMLIGWMHYLAFDLFVGMWEFRDAQRISLPHLLLVPCLLLTLLFGPIGFVLYWVFSKWYNKIE